MFNIESNINDWVAVGLEPEGSTDPARGPFFNCDYQKHDDLKEMLDSSRDSLKLEAMKRIIEMVAKGKDVSNLFPSVVKNVVSKKIEVKKLVYLYLLRYAEEQPDLALLSISTFQRALKEPNQLIRASALRVLSNIRVSMIVPIVLLAIRDAAADMSPYVRKTAAHAIPKLYRLDPNQKLELIIVIQKLLADQTVLVIGSAVMAFLEVCPEQTDLIHPIFRKLCTFLIDVDEWGQVVIVNMLTRYARTQFADPNDADGKKDYSDLDRDHKLLICCSRPLLQSQNAAVVMSVAQLYHHCAPKKESVGSARALVRLLRSRVEVQNVVLNTVASMAMDDKSTFEPYLKNFFVRTSDPTHVKLLKLKILINLATDCNVSTILRELQAYLLSNDKKFLAATIQAIGKCAYLIPSIRDSCLNGLVALLSNKDEAMVAESVIVIKRLLQMQSTNFKEIINQVTRLLDIITIPQARAAILWLLGEYSRDLPVVPDVLRKITKTFSEEHDIVKFQILNLTVKLYIINPEEVRLLCQYVFNLARYDQNYDIRDRARFLKQFTRNQRGILFSQASKIFLAEKPAPLLFKCSQFMGVGGECLQLGSLAHYINARTVGYRPLPSFPQEVPPKDVRDVGGEVKEYTVFDNSNNEDESVSEETSETEESSSTSSSSSDESFYNGDLCCSSTVSGDMWVECEFEKQELDKTF